MFVYKPVLADFLESHRTCKWVVGIVILYFGLGSFGVFNWQCPIWYTLGIPCPGCGLSRAIIALVQGDWERSFTLHAFAPFFLLALILITIVTLLPALQRQGVINWISLVERHTGITNFLLIGLVFYWLGRLLILQETFIHLIAEK